MSLIPQVGGTVYQTTNNKLALRTGGSGTLLDGIVFDSFFATFPSSTVEVYEYYQGGLAGTVVATVTITYTDATKTSVLSGVRT